MVKFETLRSASTARRRIPSHCALEGTDPHPGLKNETDEMQQCEMDERDGAEFITRQFSHVKILNRGVSRIQRGFMVGVVFFNCMRAFGINHLP
jgi:hypothetical protein